MMKKHSTHTAAVFVAGLLIAIPMMASSRTYTADWESLKQHRPSPAWFQDAKLGVYFFWGPYIVPECGGDWYSRWMYTPGINGRGQWVYDFHQKNYGSDFHYHDFFPLWTAEKFDAAEWIDIFEDMGSKYIGAIAEFHGGFSMWDSEVNPWNAADMGPKTDLIKALCEEARKRDLKFMATFHSGFNMMYYPRPENGFPRVESKYNFPENPEFTYPKGGDYDKLYGNMSMEDASKYWLAKVNEVVDQYCPDYIWMDFGQRFIGEEQRKAFLAHYFNKADELGKEVVINNKGKFFPDELAIVNVERATLPDITEYSWVTDFKLGPTWGFNKNKRTTADPQKFIRVLAEVVSKNGNMIICVAPMANGQIPEEQVAAMQKIGAWMKRYGEAIYATRPFVAYGEGVTEIKPDYKYEWNTHNLIRENLWDLNAGDVRFTRKDNIVYAIQLGWPGGGQRLLLKTFAKEASALEIESVSVMGTEEKIRWKRTPEGLEVFSPREKPPEADAAFVYKMILNPSSL
ncbi:alpha-L-fucosidase [Pontiella agarivorans]|uniref:alpha-L-fucosidase n=1 Tax=Pontiella agarivorans TaxID=3038953 RepID=A0ABU5MWA2_9BACT|nr:alpha-L-fucosidase [Pontiella agarivorans]MDZ8118455.1 alpha-L-fucosidase [Pontiella agarivorans]